MSLKKLKEAIRSSLGLQEFFMSDIFRQHFEGIVKMVSNRYNQTAMRVKLAWGGDTVAYTDNRLVYVNADNPLICSISSLEERYLCLLGLLGHELGHVLHTDFEADEIWRNRFCKGEIYCGYDNRRKDAADEMVKYKCCSGYIFKIYAHLENCIEDRYVNEKIGEQFPGTFKSGIQRVQANQFEKDPDLLPDDVANLLNVTIQIAIQNRAPQAFIDKYPCLKDVLDILSDIPSATTMEQRIRLTNDVLLVYWPYMKKAIDESVQNSAPNGMGDGESGQGTTTGEFQRSGQGAQGQSQSEKDSLASALSRSLNRVIVASQRGKGTGVLCEQKSGRGTSDGEGNSSNQSDSSSDTKSSDSGLDRKNDGSKNGEQGTDESDNHASSNPSNGQGAGESASERSKENESDPEKAEGDSDAEQNGSEGRDENSSGPETSQQGLESFQDVSALVSFHGDSSDGCSEESRVNVVERLLAQMARDMMNKSPEKAEELISQQEAGSLTSEKGSCHYGYPFVVKRISSNGNRASYQSVAGKLIPVSRRLQKKMSDVLEDKNDGGVCKNLLQGNKVNPAASASSKGRIFKRTNLPESQDLAVSVLIDESGSMSGTRIRKALEMAILIEDFCRGLHVPVAISGHSDVGGKEVLRNYICFEDTSNNRMYSLTHMASGGCNRDGLALRHCIRNLAERDEEVKLMIVISDGRPNSQNYWGSDAENDLFQCKKEVERMGGLLIAASIGEDKDTLKRIYKDSFLDISDLNSLPIKMVKLISGFIR